MDSEAPIDVVARVNIRHRPGGRHQAGGAGPVRAPGDGVEPAAGGAGAAGSVGDTQACLTFIRPSAVKPVFESAAYTGGAPRLFFSTEDHAVTIRDLRHAGLVPTLDREGFELQCWASRVADFYDDAVVRRDYYPEIEAWLMRRLGARQVVVFDTTRRSDAESGAHNPDGVRQPARRVHVDYTQKSGPQRVRDVLGTEQAEHLARTGARIVQLNVWRPIRGPVLRSPLAVADASSVRPESRVATDQIFPDRVGEIYHLAYDCRQRWYYVPRMRTDEVLLIKGWDSMVDGRARFTPHGAFTWAQTPREASPRESIEVRTLAIIA